MGRVILEFFCEKSHGPPTSWNGLMRDPSEILKQKKMTLPPPPHLPAPTYPIPGHEYFSKLERFESLHCEKGELYTMYGVNRRMSCQERNGHYVNFARRMRVPALHFQLDDHILTMASCQPSIISLRVKPPPMAVSRMTSSLELRWSDCLRKVN